MSTNTVNFGWILPTPGGDTNIWGSPILGLNNTIINQDTLVRALANTFIGNSAPSVAQSGTMWINNTTNPWIWSVYNLASTTWIEIGAINTTTNTFTPASNSVGTYAGDYKISAQTSNHGVWLLCNGAAVSRSTYSGLNALMAAQTPPYPFGNGDGSTTFNLPDLRGAVAGGTGKSGLVAIPSINVWEQPTTWAIGRYNGEEAHTLSIPEMPVHQHFMQGQAGSFPGTTGGIIGGAPTNNGSINAPTFNDSGTSFTGGTAYVTQTHNTMQPTVFAGNYFISFGG